MEYDQQIRAAYLTIGQLYAAKSELYAIKADDAKQAVFLQGAYAYLERTIEMVAKFVNERI